MNNLILSTHIENLLVARNPRGMQTLQAALVPGYYLRAAQLLLSAKGTVLIGTGFPVAGTYETDGPVGAIALYRVLETLGTTPVLVCGAPLADAIASDFRVHKISVGEPAVSRVEAKNALHHYQPSLVISIERPGMAADGKYYNMRGEDISSACASFDYFLRTASCPTIGIGDGGNEIGMGNVADTLAQLNIIPSATCCDELLIADVSNWAAHGLIAMLSVLREQDMLLGWDNLATLQYLSARGSVDGVSRKNSLTEDSLGSDISEKLIKDLRKLGGFC
ncbi:DUF4392 domain-containing protein [SAR92 clade bacterium H455]|uniref:DUF4392 domain-containing protein n=1 Tax=SAR92 clade bacterium H455 TaxID=2974818 RepID=A0ABY5TU34_9GAMM|nr:DUF4392 domain-containing protein [SAR92 clade bacterium H455]